PDRAGPFSISFTPRPPRSHPGRAAPTFGWRGREPEVGMHALLRYIVLEPKRVRARLGDDPRPLARKLVHLTRLNPQDLFYTLICNFFFWRHGARLGDMVRLPEALFRGFRDVDDLFDQVVLLYQEATGTVPPNRQDVRTCGHPVRIL